MRNREIGSQYNKIKSIIERTRSACDSDIEIAAHWARYLCVLSAGFLENALALLFVEKIQRTASPYIISYVAAQLATIQNPKSRKFVETARSFKEQWGVDLEAYMGANGRKEAIDSIMTRRHEIAHGKDSNISLSQVIDYLKKSVDVLEYIEDELN
jgi:hypothetical protein